ncbi:hypothetical protein BVX95_02380 [archaeon D22]|nr:hypothetical protein BVX95_02380 [archaeon D22]
MIKQILSLAVAGSFLLPSTLASGTVTFPSTERAVVETYLSHSKEIPTPYAVSIVGYDNLTQLYEMITGVELAKRRSPYRELYPTIDAAVSSDEWSDCMQGKLFPNQRCALLVVDSEKLDFVHVQTMDGSYDIPIADLRGENQFRGYGLFEDPEINY